MDPILWQPDPDTLAQCHMSRFMRQVNETHQLSLSTYPELYHWSFENKADFWAMVWRYCDIKASNPWETVIDNESAMPGAKWFPAARLNFAENLLRYRDDHAAILFRDERGNEQRFSYQELYQQVTALASALRQLGVKPGDRIAALMPNIPQTVIAMLATTSLGAIWSSCSPDFGRQGIRDRFGQIDPTLLFCVDGYYYNGKTIDLSDKLAQMCDDLPSLKSVINYQYINQDKPASVDSQDFEGLIRTHFGNDITFPQLPFDHPVYIMYSSGTTGKPKCIVHGAGGTLIQHLKEHQLHCDLHRTDRVFYYTTCGWMMWNWLVSALASGSTLVLYDGSPTWPAADSLFNLIDDVGISVFGTSARYLSALEKQHVTPVKNHNLDSLRSILSTGSPLLAETFDYVYQNIKPRLQLSSISGGTDIISCFALGNPLLPVYRGQLQCRGLGMQVEIFDSAGHSIQQQKGELVCTAPFPSMPVGFWNDENNTKYTTAYFSTYPGVWSHGDYAEITAEDGLVIFGRSDATLNPGGVRIGSAEIYRQVDKIDTVLESLAIGQEWQGDVRIILFVILDEGVTLTESLRKNISTTIRNNASPRHVPAHIIQVPDLPRTMNGKLVELAVKNIIHNKAVTNIESLSNPDSLDFFRNIPELHT